jgi:hypothetical protein
MILFVVVAGVKQALPGVAFQAPGRRQQELTSSTAVEMTPHVGGSGL